MAKLNDIINWCNSTLKSSEFKDYAPNGLQIEGAQEVTKILCAVTASQDAIDAAIAQNADLLLVHHGYFWKGEAYPITGMRGKRIRSLIKNDISLVGYHLPLDSHPTLGNNAAIAEILELENIEALDENGKKIVIKAKDLLAICLCHEIDHLDGILFTDKATELFDANAEDEE